MNIDLLKIIFIGVAAKGLWPACVFAWNCKHVEFTEEMIAEHLQITDNAWLADIHKVWQKHFKGKPPDDLKIAPNKCVFCNTADLRKNKLRVCLNEHEYEQQRKYSRNNSQFLDYFHEHRHEIVPSSSLIPVMILHSYSPMRAWCNSKMFFLGKETRPYKRATSSQRCVRAGGKHNDLERVGYTARHHTFFEMLGNFSFGDYFKRDAIQFAWEFLTEKLQLPPEKLWVTVYEDDKEAEDIWLKEIKIDPKRFSRCGEHDNFWSMGPTGPCGPCTEIFYDHGPTLLVARQAVADADGDRYIEIWNLVFMQYDRAADGTLTPLPKPSVDTGMGLERIAAVMQGVHNNYDTDFFQPLIKAAAKLAGIKDYKPIFHCASLPIIFVLAVF